MCHAGAYTITLACDKLTTKQSPRRIERHKQISSKSNAPCHNQPRVAATKNGCDYYITRDVHEATTPRPSTGGKSTRCQTTYQVTSSALSPTSKISTLPADDHLPSHNNSVGTPSLATNSPIQPPIPHKPLVKPTRLSRTTGPNKKERGERQTAGNTKEEACPPTRKKNDPKISPSSP